MAKLALYFNDNQDQLPRILDTDAHVIGKIWKIGRLSTCDIVFSHAAISKIHAALQCREVLDDFTLWEIMAVGKNPIYRLRSDGTSQHLPQNEWIPLEDGDRIFFVLQEFAFTCTTAIDETLEKIQEELLDDEPETAGKTKAQVTTQSAQPETWPSVVKEIGLAVLNGPDGCPDWLWWLFLALCLMAYVVLKYGG